MKNSPNVRGVIAVAMVVLLVVEMIFYAMHFVHEFKNVKKVNRKFAKIEWRKLKAWRIHNFAENKTRNKKKIAPAGLVAKLKAGEKSHEVAGKSAATPAVASKTAASNTAASKTEHPETVDDLFDLFENTDSVGFDIDDIFDDGNVFDGTANKELDFMNM